MVDGEIQIQAKSQALGYWFDGNISQLKTQDGWFKTNDKGIYIDNEYQVIGRLDNLFISGGECVQPEDIEAVINSHPSVGQSFVIPIDDSEFGQRPVAVIELTEEISLASIAAWLKDKLTPYQYPAHFYQLANELKSHGIKISRRQVRHWVLNQMGAEK
ncbi:O-succinylbenzoic acid--CoA ligase [Providencia sneebia DSM 19967]|uniref:O-succinylbenzoic acid--CoA ligase n=1 Tax=Providencia sneebia DSM 19967 TaxID=1141660 RepID=K8WDQ7_9GAMM|nr:O-succinylbenzoic acid--CoA ligase [Providencia sneebia DSM 19967]